MSSLIGRKLGQYEITALVGQGGMATVYLANQPSLERNVAIKVLPPHPGMNQQFIQRFELEAKTVGRLQHPHILPLFDYGSEGDILYLVMGYLEGGSLSDLIDRGAVDPKQVEKILRELASAVDYAHRQGVIHRDIKPGNVLIDAEGHTILTDFGIVKMATQEGSGLTGTNIVGTPAYMAPEQAQGMEVDERADIYALGTVIFELLTGQQPYQADTVMQVLVKQINDPVPSLLEVRPDLSESLDDVMQKVLAKNPDDRYSTAADFAEDFSRALHEDDSSLAAVRSQYPITDDAQATITTPPSEQATVNMTGTPATDSTPSQTIIVQQNTNPLILLGGFGLIALVIVIVAIVLINQDDDGPQVEATSAAVVIDETEVVEAAPPTVEAPPPTTEETPSFGQLRYNSVNGLGDTINFRLNDLDSLSDGTVYAVWLLNTETEETFNIGQVIPDNFGEGILTYTDEEGRILPAHYNAVILTVEESIGDAPTGDVVYSGSVPLEISASLNEIFVASEVEKDGEIVWEESLLSGAITEAEFASQHAGLAARATNVGGLRSHAEHTINIIQGTEDDFDGDGRGTNPGRGIGLYFFLDLIEGQLLIAADAPGSSIELQTNTEFVRVCWQNVRDWADQVIVLEKELLEAEDIESVAAQAAESTELTNAMINGVDANENGNVEPFEGECGLQQMQDFGIEMAAISLQEGALDNGE